MVPMLIGGSINTIGYGIATLGSALGVAWIFASLINGTARQPEAHKPMFQATMIGFAVVEALALFGFVLAFIAK
ncbi:ATP synthase subunit C [Cutibacterium granulosum]|uniref:ATP synthase subunit c n=3 Tax=Cutibacterium granulosum TaxID=33011 RepID=U1F218_9ACTN|nr:ATP synthase subunit C [Cutibacterium granulosum]ERS33260.1 hypothetical protein HMPREF1275_01460 [Propionibacterium sp. KPL1844]MBX7471993.1 F0F1 ATP synthase subunit C [Streptomyces sp. MAG02]MDU1862194.1 F0F1 ATP synthase subunit C [Propionibacterium sp.]MDU3272423.1 F0F1 ATP synthase subunit C [Cutibacterium sp.]ERF57987.1 ATP synthase subunit c [Cutibacterium granulosum DSM 20700]